MARFLVTGAAGFIGSHIVEHLLKEGHYVVGVDNFSIGYSTTINFLKKHSNSHLFTFFESDLRNINECYDLCRNVDFVLHHAALSSVPMSIKEPAIFMENNIASTANLLEASSQQSIKRFVLASSASVYGVKDDDCVESDILKPISPYAISKASCERLCYYYYYSKGLKTINLRYFNVYGARQNPFSDYAAVVPLFIHLAQQDKPLCIFGDGSQTRDFINVLDVVKANLNACHNDDLPFGTQINIASGESISVLELAESIKSVFNSQSEIVFKPYREGDVKNSSAKVILFKKYLDCSNSISIEKGLESILSSAI